MKKYFLISLSALAIYACGNKTETAAVETKTTNDSVMATPVEKPLKSIEPEGVLGVIEVPEILTLAVTDSAKQEDIGFLMGKAYNLIESDMRELGLHTNDMPAGALYYNNDPKNFIFECVVPIDKMPAKQPKHSNIVVLEATKAVVYNYYGPYDKMFNAYGILQTYLKDNKLEQSGVSREFYLSDPTVEKDPNNWLSKIYIPVK